MDDIDSCSFLEDIDDFLNFPTDDVKVTTSSEVVGNFDSLPDFWNPDSFPGPDSVFFNQSSSDLSAGLLVPYEDIVPLESMDNSMEDSFHDGCLAMKREEMFSNDNKELGSLVSVLEMDGWDLGASASQQCGRTTAQPLVSAKASSISNNFAVDSQQVFLENMMKKKIHRNDPVSPLETNENSPSQPLRKCMHCEIMKTPQWRSGPLGPKTLCNACGVRYKSGRLFPEYRPAISPTFVPTIHSNSHRKVVEMRNKNKENTPF